MSINSNTTFTVPPGVTSITVHAWGGGGKGSTGTSDGEYGGGGGGAYAKSILSVSPGQVYDVFVGAGSTTTSPGGNSRIRLQPAGPDLVLAVGGNSLADNVQTGATGGAAGSCIGTVVFSGGQGGNGLTNSFGGGGGSSGGTSSNGNYTVSTTSSSGGTVTGGGSGGNGATADDNPGNPGNIPGGGGGGPRRNNGTQNGGNGADGQVLITWEVSACPTYSLSTTTPTTPICAGGTSIVTLVGPAANLPTGTYTVTYSLSTPNTATGNTATMTVSLAGTGTFTTSALANSGATTLTVTNLASGTCSNAVSTNNTGVITVNGNPTASNAGSPQTICSTGSATLAANAPGVGTGAWSVVSGPSLSSAQFSNIASNTATFTPAGGAGNYTLRWTISNAPCPPSTSDVVITVNAPPTTANAGTPQTACIPTPGSITLAANNPSV